MIVSLRCQSAYPRGFDTAIVQKQCKFSRSRLKCFGICTNKRFRRRTNRQCKNKTNRKHSSKTKDWREKERKTENNINYIYMNEHDIDDTLDECDCFMITTVFKFAIKYIFKNA